MDWPTIRELLAYVFGNALGLAAATAFVLGVWQLVTGPTEDPLQLIGLLGSGAIAYWWIAWAMREYVRPAADRARAAASDEGPGADPRT